MCPALGVTRQGYYAWRRRPPSAPRAGDAELARPIPEACEASRRIYGARRVRWSCCGAGALHVAQARACIMRDNGWSGTTRGCAGSRRASRGSAPRPGPPP